MRENFQIAMKPLAAHEGGYSNHPDDPGGATMRGITQRVYDGYRKTLGKPTRSVRYLDDAEHDDIYRRYYWDKIWGDQLPAGVDYCVFDAAVNSGVTQATKWLQRAAEINPDDGSIGFGDLGDLQGKSSVEIINSICDQRLSFMKKLRNWNSFAKGWSVRVADVRKLSLALANRSRQVGTTAPVPLPPAKQIPAEETGRALPSDVRATETPTGDLATKVTTGTILTAFMTALSQASDYIALITGLPPKLLNIVVVGVTFIVMGGIVAFAVLAIRDGIRRRRRGSTESETL